MGQADRATCEFRYENTNYPPPRARPGGRCGVFGFGGGAQILPNPRSFSPSRGCCVFRPRRSRGGSRPPPGGCFHLGGAGVWAATYVGHGGFGSGGDGCRGACTTPTMAGLFDPLAIRDLTFANPCRLAADVSVRAATATRTTGISFISAATGENPKFEARNNTKCSRKKLKRTSVLFILSFRRFEFVSDFDTEFRISAHCRAGASPAAF